MKRKKESNLVTRLTIFLGYLKRHEVPDITEDDRRAIVRTIYLLKKYLPYYQKKEESIRTPSILLIVVPARAHIFLEFLSGTNVGTYFFNGTRIAYVSFGITVVIRSGSVQTSYSSSGLSQIELVSALFANRHFYQPPKYFS